MASQKKVYRSTDIHNPTGKKGAVGHQKRGGIEGKCVDSSFGAPGNKRKSAKRYPTRPLSETIPEPSPAWLAARKAKKLSINPPKKS